MEAKLIAELKLALQIKDKNMASIKINTFLDIQNNIELNIAVTGETGSGKSTFVNAFRGIEDGAEGAAPTGCNEITEVPTPYTHPVYPSVKLWDLPGIGTTKFPAEKYLKRVEFEKFDFFIIISATRFRENDVKLAKKIRKMKKSFYFVRSKIDSDLDNERRCQKSNFNREKTLEEMRKSCIKGLQKEGFESPQVFLVSSFKLHEYDFSLLEETLERELPEHKKEALQLTTPIISLEIIEKKKEAFKSKIKYYACAALVGASVPIPGLCITVDLTILVSVITQYVFGFGLDVQRLQKLAARTGLAYAALHAVVVSPLAATDITKELVLKVLTTLSGTAALMAAEEGAKFLPLLGIPAAMGISFTTTYRALNYVLDLLAEDARNVFKKALGRHANYHTEA